MVDTHHAELAHEVGIKKACRLLGRPRATHYRRCRPPVRSTPAVRPSPPNALSETERQGVLDLLHEPGHADLAGRSMTASICAPSPPCTGFWGCTENRENGAGSGPTRPRRSPS